MGGKSPNSAYFSVQASVWEKKALDEAAKAAGMNRNAYIRAWIRSLPAPKPSPRSA